MQILSLPVSLVALSYAATKAYYLQRIIPYSDPDPSVQDILLVLPCFLIVTFCYGVTWAFILAYTRAFVFVFVAAVATMNVLAFKAFHVELSLVLSKLRPLTTDDGEDAEADRAVEQDLKTHVDAEMAELKWKAVFTSMLTPCVVGHHKSSLLQTSAYSTSLVMLACLITLPIVAELRELRIDQEAPIIHCFHRNASDSVEATPSVSDGGRLFCKITGNIDSDCTTAAFQVCRDDCRPRFRSCSVEESELTVLSVMVIPTLAGSMTVSLLICLLLSWLSDFSNVFKLTNLVLCGRGFLHRSLLHSLVAEGDHEALATILSGLKTDPREALMRTDANGDTLLHVACSKGYTKCVDALLRGGAETRIRNANLMWPAHLAAERGSLACLRRICEEVDGDMSTFLDSEDGNHRILLDYAVRQKNRRMARYLLLLSCNNLGKDIRKKRFNAMSIACSHGSPRQVKAILNGLQFAAAEHDDIDSNSGNDGLRRRRSATPRISVNHHGDSGEQQDLSWLEYNGDEDGRTPLHVAAGREGVEHLSHLIMYLEARGRAAEWPIDNNGVSPLDVAVANRNIWACKLLVDYLGGTCRAPATSAISRQSGHEIGDTFLKEGATIMHYALYTKSLKSFEAVVLASEKSRWQLLGQLLSTDGDHDRPGSRSVLHILVRKNDIAFLEFAVDHLRKKVGAQALEEILNTDLDSHGCNLLHVCAVRNKTDYAQLLLGCGAAVDVRAKGDDGGERTPLHRAISRRSKEAAELLLEAGASLEAVDGLGLTALHLAVLSGSADMVRLVASKGGAATLDARCRCHGRTAGELLSEEAEAVPARFADLVYRSPDGERLFEKEEIADALWKFSEPKLAPHEYPDIKFADED